MPEVLTAGGLTELAIRQVILAKDLITIQYSDALAQALPEAGDETRGLPTIDEPQQELFVEPRILAGNYAYTAGVLAGLGNTSITLEHTLERILGMTASVLENEIPGSEDQATTFVEVTGITDSVQKMYEIGVKIGGYMLAGILREYAV